MSNNTVFVHLETEINPTLEVNTEVGEDKLITIQLVDDVTIFMTSKQADILFNKLDIAIHAEDETSKALNRELGEYEDRIFVLDAELDEANGTIEYLRELRDEERYRGHIVR